MKTRKCVYAYVCICLLAAVNVFGTNEPPALIVRGLYVSLL